MPFFRQISTNTSQRGHRQKRALWLLLTSALLLSATTFAANDVNETSNTNNSKRHTEIPSDLDVDEITVVSYQEEEFNDPLMGFNRAMFAFNDISYRYVLIPVAKTYNYIAPKPVRTGVSNVFSNIKAPITIINQLLQWEPAKAGKTTARFLVNTTIGIAGIFDPANAWFDLPKDETGFSDTLAEYGSGYGTYLVLPFIGPSDLRSGTGVVADYFLNPIPHITEQPDTSLIMAADAEQEFAPKADSYETLHAKSKDPYLFFRNMYLQGILRDQEFKHEESPSKPIQQ